MKKLLALTGIGIFGYACMFAGRVYQTIDIGTLYRRAELGDESAITLMELLSDAATDFNENFTKLKKTIRRKHPLLFIF